MMAKTLACKIMVLIGCTSSVQSSLHLQCSSGRVPSSSYLFSMFRAQLAYFVKAAFKLAPVPESSPEKVLERDAAQGFALIVN